MARKMGWICLCVCHATLLVAAAPLHWFLNPEFQQALDQGTQSRSYRGNALKLLVNGPLSFQQRMENAAGADVILIKAFEFWGDESATALLNLLIERAKQGAKVFIQYDVKGTLYPVIGWKFHALGQGTVSAIPPYLQRFIQESGGNGFVLPSCLPHSWLSKTPLPILKDHQKCFITWKYKEGVTPVRAILGGMNIGDMYFLTGTKDAKSEFKAIPFYESEGFYGSQAFPMRDVDFEVVGTVTEDIISSYIQGWELELQNPGAYFQAAYAPLARKALQELKLIQKRLVQEAAQAYPPNQGDAFVRYVYELPQPFRPPHPNRISNLFLLMLQRVPDEARVQFETSFFLPTKKVWRGITRAAHRGVVFDILSNPQVGPEGVIANVAMAARQQMRHFLKIMPADQINFYEWQGDPDQGLGSVFHQKIYSFGLGENEPCCIGSVNLNTMSLYWDAENIMLIQSPEFKRQINELLRHDFSPPYSKKIKQEDLDRESFWERLKQFVINKFLRSFA